MGIQTIEKEIQTFRIQSSDCVLRSLLREEKMIQTLVSALVFSFFFYHIETKCVRAERVERDTTNSNSATAQPSQTTHTETLNQKH